MIFGDGVVFIIYFYAIRTDSRTKAGTETETYTTADVASEVAGDAFG